MSLPESSTEERTIDLQTSSLNGPSKFSSMLEEKFKKSKVVSILERELQTDVDDGRIKLCRLVTICVHRKNNRKSKITLNTDVIPLEPDVELLYEMCKAGIIRAQERFFLSKPQHEFCEIFSCHLEILTLYSL